MRRIGLLLLLILSFSNVKAADFTTSISGNKNIIAGSNVTLTFKIKSEAPIYGITANIDYDTNYLELVSKEAGSGFTLTYGTQAVLDTTKAKNGTFTFLTLKFKTKSSFKVGTTTNVSIKSITASDGDKTLTGSTSKITLKSASNDNTLKSLTIDGKLIEGFKADTIKYSLTVENSTSKVTLGASTNNSNAKVSGTGVKNLNIYGNTFKIVVTSEALEARTYTIEITRKDQDGYVSKRSNNALLKSLTTSSYDLDFKSDIYTYDFEVKNEVTKLEVTAVGESESAIVEIDNPTLVVGLNKITIKVTAEDGTKKEYILNVTRSNENPQIKIADFKEIASKTSKDTLEVLVDSEEIISKDDLQIIKDSGKNVIFAHYEENKLIYAWHVLNADLKTDVEFKTQVLFSTEYVERINELTNYAEAFFISSLNSNQTKAKIKVLTNLQDSTNLYYYDEKIHLQSAGISINEAYVEFPFTNNNYFLSRMEVKNKNNALPWILIIENSAILISALIFLWQRKRLR